MKQELLEILEVVREEEREILEGRRRHPQGALYRGGFFCCVRTQDDGKRQEADPDQDPHKVHRFPETPPRFY